MEYIEIIENIIKQANPGNVKGMARYGINPENTYGVSIPILRNMAKEIGKDHLLALKLWDSNIHEARIIASMIDDPQIVTKEQMEKWVSDFDSWDVCDQCCNNLLGKTRFAYQKANEWGTRKETFVKRAGFVLMACLAVSDKKTDNSEFYNFLNLIKNEATDDRNFVKKAVNWALRQIGKRNKDMNKMAINIAQEIQMINSKSARWIASDAIRELKSEKIQKKLKY